MMDMGVEGMCSRPATATTRRPTRTTSWAARAVRKLFRAILSNRKPTWKFNMSPLFLEFLMGERNYDCTPWGCRLQHLRLAAPCYLLQDGYAESFQGADGNHKVGRVRRGQRQSQVRQLHGELRL
jgi:hypothetical protein